jgi:transcriptional regulator with XRE-family HTH domain
MSATQRREKRPEKTKGRPKGLLKGKAGKVKRQAGQKKPARRATPATPRRDKVVISDALSASPAGALAEFDVSLPLAGADLGLRLRQARMKKKLTQQQLADLLGEYQSNISAWEKGAWAPSRRKLVAIAGVLTIDPLWLEYGDATLARSAGAPKPFKMVPMISWVEAGEFSDTSDPYPVGAAERHIAFPSTKETLIALTVAGSSCDREFPPGTSIIVDYADKQLTDGKFYVFRYEGKATLKRYRASPLRLEPFSSDPSHETIFPGGEVEVVGRVIAKLKEY